MRKPRVEDLYSGRLVHYSGTVYRVEWQQEGKVGLVVPLQESTMIYQPYPAGIYSVFSRIQVSINSPFLWIDDEVPSEPDVSRWRLGDRLRVTSVEIEGTVVNFYRACGKLWVKILTPERKELEFFDSEDLQQIPSSLEDVQKLEPRNTSLELPQSVK